VKNLFSWFQPAPRRRFTLHDFVAQIEQVQALGPMSKVMRMIPGMSQLTEQMNIGEGEVEAQLVQMQSIYRSMTIDEREDPDCLNGSRRTRIAAGAGVHTRDVSTFQRQFELSREMMDRLRRRL
jgi:signal recognition particle subunit SRP54